MTEERETVNLIEGIQIECNRVRELISQYESIGTAGTFGKMMLQDAIKQGEASIAGGDVVEMLGAFERLKGCE